MLHEALLRQVPASVDIAALVALREDTPAAEASVEDLALGSDALPPTDGLRIMLSSGSRIIIRPSGTEPKVKLYGEGIGIDPAPLLDALATLVSRT